MSLLQTSCLKYLYMFLLSIIYSANALNIKPNTEISSPNDKVNFNANDFFSQQNLNLKVNHKLEAGQILKSITPLLTNLTLRLREFLNEVPETNQIIDSVSKLGTILNLQLLKDDSAQCLQDLAKLAQGLSSQKLWALSMLDSFGRPGNNLLKGNLVWPGSLSTCVKKPKNEFREQADNKPFQSQYCWANIKFYLPTNDSLIESLNQFLQVRTALCVPVSCSEDFFVKAIGDIQIIDPTTYELVNVTSVSCIPTNHSILNDYPALLSLLVCVLLTILLCVGTVYDLYLYRRKLNDSFHFVQTLEDSKKVNTRSYKAICIPQTQKNLLESIPRTDKKTELEDDVGSRGEILLSFSVYSNAKKILSLSTGKESFDFLNGIRVMAICSVVSGHTILFLSINIDNFTDLPWIYKTLWVHYLIHALNSMTTFLVISGVLVSYNTLKTYEMTKGKMPWLIFYLHRLWRLTPTFMFMLFVVHMNLMNYIVDSPLTTDSRLDQHCSKNWWQSILYIQNFFPLAEQCMPMAWYLDVDLQLYFLSPIILIPLAKGYKKLVWIMTACLSLEWIICWLAIPAYYDIPANFENLFFWNVTKKDIATDKVYTKPYARFGEYMVGLLCGCLLYRTKCSIHIRKEWLILGWSGTIIFFISNILILYYFELNRAMSSIYYAATNHLWALSVGWIIVTCATGHGGIVNTILSWTVWRPLSRLTFSVYLIHELAVLIPLAHSTTVPNLNFILVLYYCLASVLMSYIMALILCLAVEWPLQTIEKYFMEKYKPKK